MRRIRDAVLLGALDAGKAAIALFLGLLAFGIAWNLGGAILRALGDLLSPQDWEQRLGTGWVGLAITTVFLLVALIGFAHGAWSGWTLHENRGSGSDETPTAVPLSD